jgi:mannose-1-phosphate guanylyltransferase
MHLRAIIMAGGQGSRLWPYSRSKHPKQFLCVNSENTMLQDTARRLSSLNVDSSITICNEEHRFFVAEQLNKIDKLGSIILEPCIRNTAPAVALAALLSEEDHLLLVLAADHVIDDEVEFQKAVKSAIPHAEANKLVTFGIVPTKPHTGYGYIKRGNQDNLGSYDVEEFVEKPNLEDAMTFMSSKKYYWNSGMFLFKASKYLEELKKYRPNIYNACHKAASGINLDTDFTRVNEEDFKNCDNESIDFAVMENTKDAVVVPLSSGWSDIGSWSSLWDINKKNEEGNSIKGDVISRDTKNCLIQSSDRLISAVGVEDLIIVDSKDALLVTSKASSEDVKLIVENLKEENRSESDLHREVYRPWGKYDSVDSADGFQVKRLTVNPGEKLSVQMHHHRSEHWVVVSGIARVHYGEKSIDLNVNEYTYHGVEVMHALENPGEIPLELIEVQIGPYLGEDDIVRFDDKYGRN